ncbi:MAG: hypothetical protein ACXWBM_06270, partial [Chthoniobacterales bacterium]
MSATKRICAGLFAGAMAGLVMTVVMLVLASVCSIATPLTIFGDRLSVFLSVEAFLRLMGRVGGYNHMKQLGVGSVMAGQIIVGALGGAIYGLKADSLSGSGRRKFSSGLFILLPLLALSVVLWPV